MSDFEARRARFAKANENRAAAAQGNFGGYEKRDPVDYVSMEVVKSVMKGGKATTEGRPLQLRFVGGLDESSPRLPGDMKRIAMADIKYLERVETLDDLVQAQDTAKTPRKYLSIIFPDKSERRTHPLWKLVDAVLSYDWDEVKKERNYHHANDDLFPLFKELRYNNDPSNQMESGWTPGDVYLMNCISRDHMDWHRENKKTLVLSRGSWMGKDKEGNEVRRFNTGTKKTVYDGLCNELVETYGFHEEYDVLTWRVPDKPYYHIVHAKSGFEAPKWEKLGYKRHEEFLGVGDAGYPLTKEELSWELWDFDKYFQPTSPIRIFNRLGYMFKIYDEFMVAKGKKSDLWGELKVLADADKAAKEAEQKDKVAGDEDEDEPKASTPAKAAPVSVAASAPVQAEAPAPVVRRSVVAAPVGIDWDGLASGSFNGTIYKGVVKMTDAEKALVVGVNADLSFTYVDNLPPLADGSPNAVGTCNESQFKSPISFHVDPLSGTEFED